MEAMAQLREVLKATASPPDASLSARRARAAEFAAFFVAPTSVHIAQGDLGGVPVEWIVPAAADHARIFLHLHGGGYVLGDPAMSRSLTTELARRTRSRGVSVAYRLAPEHPFPAAVTDSLVAYASLLALGARPDNIVIVGESAGGGLGVATLIAARYAKLPMPAGLVAISPWTDLTCTAASLDTQADVDPLLDKRSMQRMADDYLQGADPRAPSASPAFADLGGMPPMLIQVGSDEVLLDDARALHRRAIADRVNATLEIWPGMIHVWHIFHQLLPEANAAIDVIAAFARSHWYATREIR
jgi:acetyl esterase/lipase